MACIETIKFDVGDWVRFYRNGQLVIAEVRYARKSNAYPYEMVAMTDIAEVGASYVIEVRKSQ